LKDHLNIIIVSDHGMASVSKEKVILLDNIIPLNDVEIVDLAPVTAIRTSEKNKMIIYEMLKASEEHFSVYMKNEIPDHWHYKNHKRVQDITVVAEPGYTITTSDRLDAEHFPGGNHGYAPETTEMWSFFLAAGPDFKEDYQSAPFQNIHLYELMAHLLQIEPSPNDGTIDSLKMILKP